MSEHTQGKLRLSSESTTIFVEDCRPISEEGILVGSAAGYDKSGYFPSDAEGVANARRIVAAWNACQGIPTEVLEAQQSGGLPWSVADQIEKHVTQATLVEACRRLIGCMCAAGWEDAPDAHFARAAIARATGGKTT